MGCRKGKDGRVQVGVRMTEECLETLQKLASGRRSIGRFLEELVAVFNKGEV